MKKLTLPQLQVLIDKHENTNSQYNKSDFLESIKTLKEYELLDNKSIITPFGKEIIRRCITTINKVEEPIDIQAGEELHPYKAAGSIRTNVEKMRESNIEEREVHHD